MKKTLNILKIILGFLLTLVFFEIYLTTTELSLTSNQIDNFTLKPGSRLFEINEGLYIGEINKYGYLGPSYPQQKRGNTIRIALMGDSYVEGFQLFDRYHFRNLIETKLTERLNKNIEVLNFGRSGFDFFSMYAYYKKYASNFSPDIVLFFIGEHDFYENYAEWVTLDSAKNLPEVDIEHKKLIAKGWTHNFLKGRFVLPPLLFKCNVLINSHQTGEILFGKYYTTISKKDNEGSILNDSPEIDIRLLDGVLNDLSFKKKQVSQPLIFFILHDKVPEVVNKKLSDHTPFVLDLGTKLVKYKSAGYKLDYWKATTKTGHWNHQGHQIIADFLTRNLVEHYLIHSKEYE